MELGKRLPSTTRDKSLLADVAIEFGTRTADSGNCPLNKTPDNICLSIKGGPCRRHSDSGTSRTPRLDLTVK